MANLRIKVVVASTLVAAAALAGPASQSTAAVRPPAVVAQAHVLASSQYHALRATNLVIGLDFYVPPRDAAGLARFIAAVSTPGSAAYHRYLARGEFASRFGATAATVGLVSRYLASHGLSSVSVSPDRLFVHARGPIRAVDALLHTTIREYLHKGKLVYANVTRATLPRALSREVKAVVGLTDLPQFKADYSVRSHARVAHADTTCAQMSAGTNATTGPFTISQVAAIYKYGAFASHGDLGQGQTLAVFELTDYLPADIQYYQDCTGGSQDTVTGIRVDGGGGIDLGASVEADLDIEIAATLAPKADINVYEGPNSQAGVIDTYQRIATDDTAQVTTTSWGLCETVDQSVATAESGVFAEMATQGQTVLAASGDNGASACLGYNGTQANPLAGAIGVQDPASQPLVTGVGGTTITDAATVGTNASSEVVWDGNDISGGGGGVSALWPEPSYQSGVPGASSAGRTVPDVSINGDPSSGYRIYSLGYGWLTVGGTSAGAPMVASLILLANEYNATQLGFVNPLLYHVGVHDPGVNFNDVTIGTNETYDVPGFSSAAAGFDAASGWGSPIASSFLGGDI